MSLARALSKLGYTSRSLAVRMIERGEIAVDGSICRDPNARVTPERVRITHLGQRVLAERRVVVLLHKRRSTLTTRVDPKGRTTVFADLPAELRGLHAVGRLDYATSGLLLLTNDSRLSAYLTDPKSRIPRVYALTVRGRVDAADLAHWSEGIVVDGERLTATEVRVRKQSGRESHLMVTLTEGRNRELRRLCATTGLELTRLRRIAYGGLVLGELAAGAFRQLTEDEIRAAFPGAPRAQGTAGEAPKPALGRPNK